MKSLVAPFLAASMLTFSALAAAADGLGDLPEAMVMLEPELDMIKMGYVQHRFVHISRKENQSGHDISVRFLSQAAQDHTPCPNSSDDCLNNVFGGLDFHVETDQLQRDQVTVDMRMGGNWTIDKPQYDYLYYIPFVDLFMADDLDINVEGKEWTIAAPLQDETRWIEMSLEDAASAAFFINSFTLADKKIGSCVMSQLARLGAEETWSEAEREMQALRKIQAAARHDGLPANPDVRRGPTDARLIEIAMGLISNANLQFANADEFMADGDIQKLASHAKDSEALRAAFDDIKLAVNYQRKQVALITHGLSEAEQINIICTDLAGLEIPASKP